MDFNTKEIKKGLRLVAVSLPCMFVGPLVIHSAFGNKSHPFYIPVLIIGIGICFFAAYIGFRGIRKIISGLE
ncbi:MAG: DUF6095 family protein [Capnocytophaga sp.]|nr:DUF6095 family protein [Capnocytophaga sp.]